MNDQPVFLFHPGQRVRVVAHGLNYEGVIEFCKWRRGDNLYCVEFAYDGKIDSREFFEEQLESAE